MYQGEKKERFSAQYALTGKVICGECGAKYRRVTWSKRGKKKIVWICIERLTNGTKNCKNSPTIPEEDLHKAILDNVKRILGNHNFVKDKVRDEIEAVLYKNDEYNPQAIKRKIRNYEKEIQTLRNILRETDDKNFYVNKIESIENEILNLNNRYDKVNRYKALKESMEIEHFIDVRKLTVEHHFDAIIKSIVKCVIINSDQEIRVVYL